VTTISCDTAERIDVIDVTDVVERAVAEGADGIALVSIKHTTAALVICADEPNLRDDLVRVVSGLLAEFRPFRHVQHGMANGEAHVLSALTGTQLCVPVVAGSLDLGKWQRLLLLEFDGPQTRAVELRVIGSMKEGAG
jgi:secondary thiamine-phosphate synthase enzyme